MSFSLIATALLHYQRQNAFVNLSLTRLRRATGHGHTLSRKQHEFLVTHGTSMTRVVYTAHSLCRIRPRVDFAMLARLYNRRRRSHEAPGTRNYFATAMRHVCTLFIKA